MDWIELIKLFGVPGAMLVMALVTNKLGWWDWRRVIDDRDKQISERDKRIDQLERDVRMWMTVALANNQQVTMALKNQEQLTQTVQQVAPAVRDSQEPPAP